MDISGKQSNKSKPHRKRDKTIDFKDKNSQTRKRTKSKDNPNKDKKYKRVFRHNKYLNS